MNLNSLFFYFSIWKTCNFYNEMGIILLPNDRINFIYHQLYVSCISSLKKKLTKGQSWSMRSVALDSNSAECSVRVGCSSVYCGGGMFLCHR